MSYTVKELANLSGVSVRTLHYYDEIGLLKPAQYGENGYRYYEQEQLLRLQQILFFRELDFTLTDIQEMLESSEFNQLEALKSQKNLLSQKMNRLQMLIETIDKTIMYMKGETNMSDKEMYYGFDDPKQKQYEQELKGRYGKGVEKHIEESKQRMKNWSKDDYVKVKELADEINKEIVAVIDKDISSPEVQAIIQKHFEWINRFYTPTKEVYSGLGDLYVDHPDFRKLYDGYHPRLAEFLQDAMKHYAKRNLS
jgi:DNA-binding transcriptional MerR regulator